MLCLYSAADFVELYGSAVVDGNPSGAKHLGAFAAESFTPLSGVAFGPGRNNAALTADNKVTNADPYNDGAVFWPASGWRHYNPGGAVYDIGFWGGSWSSTASTINNGHHLEVGSTNIYPQYSYSRSSGFPVRCIRD